MPRKIPRLLWVALPLVWLVYFHALTAAGLIGPDEPRYAFVAREMARSGDWITPRLWSVPWFEKPALLYWMQAAGFQLGLSDDLAPRLPVALLAVAFLVFYWWILRREFGCRAAWMATLILGTSGMWVGYSQSGVTDIPLTATYSAAMLLALPWVAKRDTRYLPLCAGLFGLAALAKGLVPIVLAVPLIFTGDSVRNIRDWLRLRVILPFAVITLPWYLLCYLRNGWDFFHEFFIVQHFSRVTSGALMHLQPWWYYLPISLAALLPWTPLAVLLFTRELLRDRRCRFLLIWPVAVLVLFSLSLNKLPGYILPMLPAVAALIGVRLDRVVSARWALAACGALVVVFPIAGQLLPSATTSGLSRAPLPHFELQWLVAIAAAGIAWELDRQGRRLAAVAAIALAAGLGIGELKSSAGPELDRSASARWLWREIEPRRGEVCLGAVKRNWDYGLAYYAGQRLPSCNIDPKPLEVAPESDRAILRPRTLP